MAINTIAAKAANVQGFPPRPEGRGYSGTSNMKVFGKKIPAFTGMTSKFRNEKPSPCGAWQAGMTSKYRYVCRYSNDKAVKDWQTCAGLTNAR